MLKERIGNIWSRLTRKYRVVVYDHESLSQARAVILKPLTVWALGIGAVLVIGFLTGILLANFPFFQRSFPGLVMGSSKEYKELQTQNRDLERQVTEMDSMLQVLRNAMGSNGRNTAAANQEMWASLPAEDYPSEFPVENNGSPETTEPVNGGPSSPEVRPEPASVPLTKSTDPNKEFWRRAQEALKAKRQGQTATSGQPAATNGNTQTEIVKKNGPSTWNLLPPIDGYVTKDFSAGDKDHFGIDLVANENSLIRSIAEGVVIFSEYSTSTGYVIGIWHNDLNLVSFYKHNSRLFKPVGSYVFGGEAIAVIGNTGINSSGTHLHFELWYDNNPVNPADYIAFN